LALIKKKIEPLRTPISLFILFFTEGHNISYLLVCQWFAVMELLMSHSKVIKTLWLI